MPHHDVPLDVDDRTFSYEAFNNSSVCKLFRFDVVWGECPCGTKMVVVWGRSWARRRPIITRLNREGRLSNRVSQILAKLGAGSRCRPLTLPLPTTYLPKIMAAQPNGTAEAPIEVPALPTVVGINFGNSYASISVLAKVRDTSVVPF